MHKNTANYIVIIQARTDSTRLPRKVLLDIEGKPLLWHIINRVKKMKPSHIVIATTARKKDEPIIKIAKDMGVDYFRGSTNDVLDRFFRTAVKFNATTIVRITADCPLIDPYESRKVVKKFMIGDYDYVSNDSETYPNGLDTECFSFNVLKKTWKEAKLKSEREHVTPHIWKNPDKFKIGIVHNHNKTKMNHLRWSVDYNDDLDFVRQIYSNLYSKKKIFIMKDIISLLKKKPDLVMINATHKKNEGYIMSLKND